MKSVFIVICFTVVALSQTARAEWSLSSHGQLTPAAVAADSSGNKILFCSPGNGYWMTEDGGQTWLQINDRIADSERVYSDARAYAIAVDPHADTLVINAIQRTPDVSMSEFHSLDGGQTWSQFHIEPFWPDPDSVYFFNGWGDYVTFVRSNPGKKYYAKVTGFGISFGGDVWNVVDIMNYSQGVNGMLFEQTRPDSIYLYGAFGGNGGAGGIFASHDGGWTWQTLINMEEYIQGVGQIHNLVRVDSTSLMALVESYDLENTPDFLFTSNDGESWEAIYPEGLPSVMIAKTELCYVPEVPGRLILGSRNAMGVWISNDYGYNWERTFNGLPINGSLVFRIQRNEYSGHIYVSLLGQGLFRSTDYCETWQQIPGPPCGVVSLPWQGTVAFEGGLARTTEAGDLWLTQGESTTLSQYETPVFANSFCLAQASIYNASELVYAYKRRSWGDDSWEHSLNVRISDLSGNDEVYIPALERTYVPSKLIPILSDSDTSYVAYDVGQDIIYIYNDSSGWTDRTLGFVALYMQEYEGTLYAYAEQGTTWKIAYSVDLGENWSFIDYPVNLEHGYRDISSELLFTEEGMFARIYRDIWFYADGSWEQRGLISDQLHYMSFVYWDIISTDTELMVVAGTTNNHELCISHDAGWTWEDQDIELPGHFFGETTWQIEYDPWRDRLWLDTGVGLAYLDNPTTHVGEEVWAFQPATYTTLGAYPNPFNSATTVTYTLSRPGEVRLEVFDLLGRRVATLHDGLRTPGEHSVLFDADGLSSGSYFLRLVSPEQTLNRRITLVK